MADLPTMGAVGLRPLGSISNAERARADADGLVMGWQTAATYAGVSPTSLRRAVAAGHIQAERTAIGIWRFAKVELDKLRATSPTSHLAPVQRGLTAITESAPPQDQLRHASPPPSSLTRDLSVTSGLARALCPDLKVQLCERVSAAGQRLIWAALRRALVKHGLGYCQVTERRLTAHEPIAVSDADVLVVWHIRRLGRSIQELCRALAELEQGGVRFICVAQGLDLDPTDEVGLRLLRCLRDVLEQAATDNRSRKPLVCMGVEQEPG